MNLNLEPIFILRDKFVKMYFGEELYSYQKEVSNRVIESVILNDGAIITNENSRQSGKTTGITATVSFLMVFCNEIRNTCGFAPIKDFSAGFFAPQQQQVKTDFDKLKLILKNCIKDFNIVLEENNGNTIRLSNGATSYCFSAAPTTNLESKTLHLIIYEEAQKLLDAKIDNEIEPMGAATFATRLFVGTAGYQICRFWKFLEQGEDRFINDYKKVIGEKRRMFELTKNPFHLKYEKTIEDQKKILGENSDAFKTQYALEWQLGGGQFITYDDLLKCEAEYDIRKEFVKNIPCVIGIDLGKSHDETVLTVLDMECKLHYVISWNGTNYDDQQNDMIAFLQAKCPPNSLKKIYIDSSATQDQFADTFEVKLRKFGYMGVLEKINFSQWKDYMCKQAWSLIHEKIIGNEVFTTPQFKMPSYNFNNKEKLIIQLVQLQKNIKANGRWECAAPVGEGYYDDCPMSLFLAMLWFSENKIGGGGMTPYEPLLG